MSLTQHAADSLVIASEQLFALDKVSLGARTFLSHKVV